MRNDIVCLEENAKGNDFIIGDVHGNKRCLGEVLAHIQKEDRLFIVGDLTDRGHDSEGVIDLVLKNRDRVFSVRGNHENECLEVIYSLKYLALKNSSLFKSFSFQEFLKGKGNYTLKNLFADFNGEEHDKFAEDYEKIKFHLENYRLWLVDLFCYELRHNYIRVNKDHIEYGRGSKIQQIEKYMDNLPYIIHVPGKNPFNVVHADMPFDNSVLIKRIQQSNFILTEKEKKYASWVRGDKKDPFLKKTNADGVITYVGHNIIEGSDLPIIRRESDTVNIDVATYDIDLSLVINHTNKNSKFIGFGRPPANLLGKKDELDKYLATKNTVTKKRSSESTVKFFEHVNKKVYGEVRISVKQDPNIEGSGINLTGSVSKMTTPQTV